jgi:uncharacterized protein YaiL (DUF2058 family)
MAKSLQDQLLKAGLIDSNKAKKSKADKRKQIKLQQKNKVEIVDENKVQIKKAKVEKLERDRELNRQQQQRAEQKALAAQIKQLILMNRQEPGDNGEAYNFVDQGMVKRLYISEAIRQQITRGRLAIVKLDQQYELVPTPVAEKIRSHDTNLVIEINDIKEQDGSDDDPYADYKIPDDLMW